jgi:CBS-domain-containing membrane protein
MCICICQLFALGRFVRHPFAAGGQIMSSVVGCTVRLVLRDVIWLSAPLAMSLALLFMIVTRTTHPPGASSGRMS